MLSFACSHAFMFYKEAGYCAPTFSFLSVYISLFLSPVHRQAVSAEAGTMSTPTNPEVKELSPVDFIQLQQYIECEYRQAGGRAGRQLSQRLTPLPSTSTSTHTHTLIYTRSWFLISRGGSSQPQSVFLQIKHAHHFFPQINLYSLCNHPVCVHNISEVWNENGHVQRKVMCEPCILV